MGKKRNAYKILSGKSQGRRLAGRHVDIYKNEDTGNVV
jgi:hypothetical protein